MKHKINEYWKEKEGTKTVWKLQAPKGILTFKTKKMLLAFAAAQIIVNKWERIL